MYSIQSLRRRKRRLVLTVIGVALSIALTVTMFSISEGLRNSTDELVSSTGVDLFIVPKGSDYIFFTADFTRGSELTADITSDLGEDANTVSPRFYPKRELYMTIPGEEEPRVISGRGNGVVPRLMGQIDGFRIERGEYFQELDDPFSEDYHFTNGNYTPDAFVNFTGEIVLNRALADELGVRPGDTIRLSTARSFDEAVDVVVRGVYVADFESATYRTFQMPLSELQYMLVRFDDPVSEILVDLDDGVDTEGTKRTLEEDFDYSPRLTVSTDRDIYNRLDSLFQTFEGFAQLIALITIVVALLFIATVMIISVKERTREIGALRAIGFSRKSVFMLVLREGFIISVAGFVLGLLMGLVDVWGLNYFIKRSIEGIPEGIEVTQLTGWVVVEVTLVGLVIGAVAGLLPAYWATRVDIAKTLRQE
ncbi:MAG: ABC transporter permease [Thermoplasmata archaeon]|nr:MAG: ABC transporter permease [Thermoplasmata archaeon]